MHNASSKAQVYIRVYGIDGISDELPLGEAGGDDFEQGKESQFTVSIVTENLLIRSLRLRSL